MARAVLACVVAVASTGCVQIPLVGLGKGDVVPQDLVPAGYEQKECRYKFGVVESQMPDLGLNLTSPPGGEASTEEMLEHPTWYVVCDHHSDPTATTSR
jgi:hypothetical protein